MFRSYRIGSVFGFPIEVNVSFLLLLAFILSQVADSIVAGLVFGVALAVSVLLHELGHALVARHVGVSIAGIELQLFGGVAKMTSMPRTANDEVLIAAAGPAVSFALGGLGLLVGMLLGLDTVMSFGWINLVLGGFNLVPALPMDGGRVLRALLTRKYDFVKSTEVSITVARGFAVLLGVYGIVTGQFLLPALAVFLWFIGSAELRNARVMRDHFVYDQNGYRNMYTHRQEDAGLDLGPTGSRFGAGFDSSGGGHPLFRLHRPVRAGGFVIRQRNGRLVIEHIR